MTTTLPIFPTSANYITSAANITSANISHVAPTSGTFIAGTGITTPVPGTGGYSYSQGWAPAHIISLSHPVTAKEFVRLNLDGSVTWSGDIDIDAAANAFAAALTLSVEVKAGINNRIKLEMRNSVFNDLINIAKDKGSLTADDLTYLLQASKIVEKLKGGN